MASHTKVLNLTKNIKIKRSQAAGRVSGGVSVWVEFGYSIRDLTYQEILGLRAAQREAASPSPYRGLSNELPGLKYIPPEAERYLFRQRYPLLRSAMEILSTGISVQ